MFSYLIHHTAFTPQVNEHFWILFIINMGWRFLKMHTHYFNKQV